mgnify:CR=1 FL=1
MAITKYKVIQKNLEAVINYAKNGEKTEHGILVSGINCLPENAYTEMMLVKKNFHKEDGRLGYHFIQSFKGKEVSAEECNDIGMELANSLWGDKYQVLVCTHIDKDNVHNHIILNSVSFIDGGKYHNSNVELALLRETNDDLCIKYGLSVVETDKANIEDEIAESRIANYNRNSGKMEFIKKVIRKIKEGMLQEMYEETRWMYTYAKKYKFQIVFYIFLGVLTTVMGLASSVGSKYLIDAVTGQDSGNIALIALFIVAMGLFSIGINAITTMISARINIKVNNEIQAEVYDKILVADWISMKEFHSGDLLNRLNGDVNTVASSILSWIPSLITRSAQFFGILAIILYYDPTMAVIALGSAPVMLIVSKTLMKKMRDYNKKMRQVSSEVMSFNEESFQNIQSVKAFDLVEFFSNKLRNVQQNYKNVYLDYNKFSVYTSSFMSVVGMFVAYACFGWGVYRLWTGHITFGTMTLFVQLSSQLSSSFKSLVSLVPSAISATTSAGRIMEFFKIKNEIKLDEKKVRMIENNTQGKGLSVELEDVNFSYNNTKTVFKNANVVANPGEIVALVGPSGEGKTTMIRLLLGLINTKSGNASIRDINGVSCKISAVTRRFFAYVPQGNTIFSGTIADNMRMVKPNATDEEIIEALKTACAYDFVKKLPKGINSKVGERGGGFSEGQAQRISIARALLRKSPILLLDEATSALDVFTERQVLRNIMNSGYERTCIVTTHRPSVLTMCDRVYRIDNGDVSDIDEREVNRLIKDF